MHYYYIGSSNCFSETICNKLDDFYYLSAGVLLCCIARDRYVNFRSDLSIIILKIIVNLVHSYCNEGFMNEDLIRKKAAQIPLEGSLSNQKLSQDDDSTWLFPQLEFSCQNAKIVEATVGIDIRGFDRKYPRLELWEKSDNDPNRFIKVACGYTVHLTSSNSTNNSVFTIKFPNPLLVKSTYILGLYQPPDVDSTVRFFYENDTASTAYQLVNFYDEDIHLNDNSSVVLVPQVHLLIHLKTGKLQLIISFEH